MNSISNQIYIFDLLLLFDQSITGEIIVKLRDLQLPRQYFSSSVVDGKLLIYGGISSFSSKLENFEVYDLRRQVGRLVGSEDLEVAMGADLIDTNTNNIPSNIENQSNLSNLINIKATLLPIKNFKCNTNNNKLVESKGAIGWIVLGGFDSVASTLWSVNKGGKSIDDFRYLDHVERGLVDRVEVIEGLREAKKKSKIDASASDFEQKF